MVGKDATRGADPQPVVAPPSAPEERLKHVRHDVRGKLGILHGALHTALDTEIALSLDQRIELAAIARQVLPELAEALDEYLAALRDRGGEVRLPD